MEKKNKFIVGGVGIFALGLSFAQEKRVHKGANPWQTKVSSEESLKEGHKQEEDSSLGSGSNPGKSSQDDKVLPKDEENEKVAQDEARDGSDENAFPTSLKNFNVINNFRKTFLAKYGSSYLKKGLFKQEVKFDEIFPQSWYKKYTDVKLGSKRWRSTGDDFKYDKTFEDWFLDDKYDSELMNGQEKLWKKSSQFKQWSKLKSQENSNLKLEYFRKWKSENMSKLKEEFYMKQFYHNHVYHKWEDFLRKTSRENYRWYSRYKNTRPDKKYGIFLQPKDLTSKELYTNKFDLILFEKQLAQKYNIDISQAAFLKWIKKDSNSDPKTGVLKYFWTQTQDYKYNHYDFDKKLKNYEKFLKGYGKDWKEYDDVWKGYERIYKPYHKYLDSFKDKQIKELDEYNFFIWSQLHLKYYFDDVYKTTLSSQPANETLEYSFYKWDQIREKIRSSLISLPFKEAVTTILKEEQITKVKTDFLKTFIVDDKKFANWFYHGHNPKSVFELLTEGIYDQNNNLLLKFDLVYYKHLSLHQQQSFFYSWFRKNKSRLKSLSTNNDDLKLLIGKNDYYLKLWAKMKTHIKLFQIKTKGLQEDEVVNWYTDSKHINRVKEIFLASTKSDATLAKINQKIANKEIGGPNYLPLTWDQFIHITMSKVWNRKITPKDSEIVKIIKQNIKIPAFTETSIDYTQSSKVYFYPQQVFDLFWKQNQEYMRTQNSYDDVKLRKEVTKLYQSQLDSLQEDKRKYWKEINAITDLWASNSFNKYEAKQLGMDRKSKAIYTRWYKKYFSQIFDLLQFKKKTYEGKQSWYKTWDDFWTPKDPAKGGLAAVIIARRQHYTSMFGVDKKKIDRLMKEFYLEKLVWFARFRMETIKEMFHHKGLFTDEEVVFSIAPSHESGYTKYVRELNFNKLVSYDWKVDKIISLFKKDYPNLKFDYSQENFGKWITSDGTESIRFKLHKYAKLNHPQSWDYLSQIVYQPQKFIEQIRGKDFAKNKGKINSWIMTKLKTSNHPWFDLSKEKLGGNIPYFIDEINQVEEYVKYNQQAYQQSGQEDKDYENWLYNWSIVSGDKHYNVYTKEGDGSEKLLWDANEWRNSLERKQIAFESIRNPEERKKVFSKWFKEFVQNKNRAALVKPLEEFVEYQFSVWFKKFVLTNYIALFDDVKDKDGKKIDYHLIHQWPKTNILLKEFINARKYSALKSYVLSQDAKGFKEFIDGKDPAWFKDFVKSRGVVLFKTFIRSQDRPWFDQFTKDKEIFIKEFKGPLLKTLKAIYHSPHLIYDDKKGSRVEVKPVIKYWAYSDPKYSQAQVDYYQWVAQQMGTKLKELVILKKYQLWSGKKFTSLEKYYQDVIIAWSKHSFAPFEIFLKNSQ